MIKRSYRGHLLVCNRLLKLNIKLLNADKVLHSSNIIANMIQTSSSGTTVGAGEA